MSEGEKVKGPLTLHVVVDGAHSLKAIADLLMAINAAVEQHLEVPSDGYHISIENLQKL